MSIQTKSLTIDNGRNASLTDFRVEIETAESVCDPITLALLILTRDKSGLFKTQWNKIAGYVTTLFGTKEQSEKVILYSYGTHLMNFEATVQYLEAHNLIKIEDDKPIITEEGLSWIAKKLLQVEESSIYSRPMLDKIITQIDACLFTDIPTLIEKTLSSDKKWDFQKCVVNGKNIILMFDWSRYGTGMIHPYIYTLLYSYSKLDNYFKMKWKENQLDVFPIDYSKIPNKVSSIELQREKNFKNIPLTTIFEKSKPSNLNEEKVEGKNHISNLWYIIEGVNIIHTLVGIAPTIEDIAMLCLTNYQHAVLVENVDPNGRKKMHESLIRYDINKLSNYGILLKDKYNNKYRYKLASTCFYDTILDKKFQVVDKQMLQEMFKTKIKMYNDVRFGNKSFKS